ncbi:MAG: helix-turn-helix domain-containing protein [bacterium]
MKLSKEMVQILGLSTYEVTMLKTLKEKDYCIQDLALETNIPRTSIYYALPHLVDRGFIESYRRNKKTFWRNVYDSKIKNLVENQPLDVLGENEKSNNGNFVKRISDSSKVYLYSGKNQAVNVLVDISNLPKYSRFYGIQPEASIVGAISENKLDDILGFNKKVNDSKLIVEGIIHEKGTDTMVQNLSPKDKKRLLASFAGRSADTARLPEGFLNDTKAEIYLYDNKKVAIVNWYENFAVTIENKDVFNLLIEMFKSTKYMLKKYDQNEKIAKKLVDLGV